MTNLEMQLRFEQKLYIHITKDINIKTIDIEFYLNEGYTRFVEEWYKVFELNESARKRLSPLIVESTLSSTSSGTKPNSRLFVIPNDVKYILQEECAISYLNCHGATSVKRIGVKPVKLDYYNKHIINPFKKPYLNLVWRLDIGDKTHELIYGEDTTTISQYYITYLKNKNDITLLTGSPETTTIEIYPEFHQEIVEKAVGVAIETFNLNNSFKTTK